MLCRFYESEDEIHRLFRSINGVILPVSGHHNMCVLLLLDREACAYTGCQATPIPCNLVQRRLQQLKLRSVSVLNLQLCRIS